MSKDVFISYKAEEYEAASWVRLALESKGISCWMAPESIRGGSSYASEIPAAIRGCKAFVLILSEKAQESKWVPRELDQAINDNRVIMPFMIENCSLKDEFGFYLTNVQRYAAYAGKEAALERLLADIQDLLGIVEQSEPVVEMSEPQVLPVQPVQSMRQGADKGASKSKKKRSGKIGLLIAGVVIVCAVMLTFVLYKSTTVKVAGEVIKKSETYLSVYDTVLTMDDMKAIGQLTELTTLRLDGCVVPHEQLGEILGTKLTSLILSDCNLSETQIASIDFSQMPLSWLDISGSIGFTSLELLVDVSDTLTVLDISNTSANDLSVLQAFGKLRQLHADNNGISDISALSCCTELSQISLNGNQIGDLSALDLCTGLTEIFIDENELTNLKGLEHSLKLKRISAHSNCLSTLEGLENTTLLETVDFRNNQLEDVSVLGKSAAGLKRVYLGGNAISDIAFLENCAELQCVNLDHNKLTTLKPLENAVRLEGVTAQGNQIVNTEGIEGKEVLKYLNLADNDLMDVGVKKPLTFKPEDGVVLNLGGNQLRSINIMYDHQFQLLVMTDYEIPKDSFLYSAKGWDVVLDYSKNLDLQALAEQDYFDYILVDCPLDQQVNTANVLGTYSTTFIESADEYYKIEDYLPAYVIGD